MHSYRRWYSRFSFVYRRLVKRSLIFHHFRFQVWGNSEKLLKFEPFLEIIALKFDSSHDTSVRFRNVWGCNCIFNNERVHFNLTCLYGNIVWDGFRHFVQLVHTGTLIYNHFFEHFLQLLIQLPENETTQMIEYNSFLRTLNSFSGERLMSWSFSVAIRIPNIGWVPQKSSTIMVLFVSIKNSH